MKKTCDRRGFFKTSSSLVLAAPYVSLLPRPGVSAKRFDPDFGSAYQAVQALNEGVISSAELLSHVYERIEKYNSRVEAFITLNEEEARSRARLADEARAHGISWGILHGLPILIKDTFATAGLRTTAGSRLLEQHVPSVDAVAVARLKAAGAIVIGKTNMPEFASDMQSFNEIANTTNNPWDLSRTPGGSTGGGAAALAAGFGFMELGSDIGGSIRTPCHFCGVYGHKPTLNLVPGDGHIPPAPGQFSPEADLSVVGPMGRSALDLRLELEVISGPVYAQSHGHRLTLTQPRGSALKDYRMGFVRDDPFCPVSPEVRRPLEIALEELRKAGAQLVEGWPSGFSPGTAFELYLTLLAAVFSEAITEEELELMRANLEAPWGHYAEGWLKGTSLNHADWIRYSGRRMETRALWQEYFRTYDAFLSPVNFLPAFHHDHELSFFERTLNTSVGPRLYGDLLRWISPATLTGCPATVAPIGKTAQGLPVGIQIMGPFLEDATPIDLAGRFGDLLGGFEPPPGFG